MNADPQLRDRLERAARFVQVDVGQRFDRVQAAAAKRGRARRLRALAAAAVIGIVAVTLAWWLLPADERGLPTGGPVPAGRIAYLGDPITEAFRGMFELDVATGDVSALSPEGASVLWAVWSPDGSRLAYILEEPGPRYAIVVADADGTNGVKILEEQDTGAAGPDLIDLSWSPDGSRIAYSGRTVERGVTRRTILIVNADGSGDPVTLDGLWVSVSWSPDGERLLMTGFPQARNGGQFDLFTVRPDGADLVRLTDDEGEEHAPSWSPDGTRIAFALGGDYDQDVYVMDANGSNVRKLTDRDSFDAFPVWSPDGRWIAFTSDRDATPGQKESNRSLETIFSGLSLYLMHADGSDVTKVLEGVDAAFPVSWRP